MRVKEYLDARNERHDVFAKRASAYLPEDKVVSHRTVTRAVAGEGLRASNAWAMIKASKAEPAPCGGTITLDDLVLWAPGAAA